MEKVIIRPPSEKLSVLLRVTRGCDWNKCKFCGIYDVFYGVDFSERKIEDVLEDIGSFKTISDKVNELSWKLGYAGEIREEIRHYIFSYGVDIVNFPWIIKYGNKPKTVFLGDSNAIHVNDDSLVKILETLYETFSSIERVTSYSRAFTIWDKERKEKDFLKRLKKAGLSQLHVGLETGSNELLIYHKKGVNQNKMIEAGKIVKDSEISLCLNVLLGLGGKDKWKEHADETAYVVNQINPDFVRFRRLGFITNSPLYNEVKNGKFIPQTQEGTVLELRRIIGGFDNIGSKIECDHPNNYIMVSGKMPKDKDSMLKGIDKFLDLPEESRLKRYNSTPTTI